MRASGEGAGTGVMSVMSVSGISDGTTQALHMAINGLDARQQAIAANVSNLETPGYRARLVSFEDSLRERSTMARLRRPTCR